MNKKSFKECFCAKEGVENKNKSHSRGFLSGIYTTLEIQGGDPRFDPAYQPCGTGSSGMTPLFNHGGFTLRPSSSRSVGMRDIGAVHTYRPQLQACGVTERVSRGFTLIELLVVVLIIGILAAVALPQYNKAVKKAQGAELLNAIDAMDKAMASFYLANGEYQRDRFVQSTELDVEMPVLKHWRYNIPPSSNLSPDFVQMGTSSYNQEQRFRFHSYPDGLEIELFWEKGKLSSVICSEGEKVNGRKCADYFNCNNKTETYYPCGHSVCPVTTTRCYLN